MLRSIDTLCAEEFIRVVWSKWAATGYFLMARIPITHSIFHIFSFSILIHYLLALLVSLSSHTGIYSQKCVCVCVYIYIYINIKAFACRDIKCKYIGGTLSLSPFWNTSYSTNSRTYYGANQMMHVSFSFFNWSTAQRGCEPCTKFCTKIGNHIEILWVSYLSCWWTLVVGMHINTNF